MRESDADHDGQDHRATSLTGEFFGRHDELARLAEVVAKVVTGTPQVVWVRGEAGIGKTSLIRQFVAELMPPERNRPFTVLDATGDAGETILEFGIVEQLVRRVDPAHRRSRSLLSGPIPPGSSPFAVGAELLDLLGVLQSAGPVALVLDDVQWTDTASAHALGFVLRRIWADQVLIVLAVRTSGDNDPDAVLQQLRRTDPGAVTIDLSGLHVPEVVELARAVRGYDLRTRAAERLRAHTGGNPLHIRTLLHELPADSVADDQRPLPAPRSMVTAVRAILDRLPASSRSLLEALAVLNEAHPLGRVAQVAGLDDAVAAVEPGVATGLLRWDAHEPSGQLRIAHMLHREAIYDMISPQRRSELHRRAAEVADRMGRWAHRVAAATASDPTLAAELEAAAIEEAATGQHSVAARYLHWAADLSPRRDDYERRFLNSCVQILFGSDRTRALVLRAEAERCAESALRSMTLGLIALFAAGDRATATRHLSAALDLVGETGDEHDRWIKAVSCAGLSGANMWRGDADTAIHPARLALRLGGLPVRLADFLRVFLAVARSRRDGMEAGLRELAHVPDDPAETPPAHLDSLSCRGAINTMLGRFAAAERDLRVAIRQHRAGCYTMSGTTPHSYLAAIHYVRGEWEDASILVHQGLSLADPDEQPHHRALRHMVASFVPSGRGEWTTASAHVTRAWSSAHVLGSAQDIRYAAIAEAVLQQARGNPAMMLAALRKITLTDVADSEGVHRWWGLWWRPLLVEALIGTGHRTEAAEHLDVLRRQAAGADYLDGTILRFEIALSCGALSRRITTRVVELAGTAPRTSLFQGLLEAELGDQLVGAGRAAEAMPFLTSARARFATLLAVPFEKRVRRTIDRCAPAATSPERPQVPGLSPREAQIAHLVGLSLTNRQIAAQLFVTTKTVEYHLANIFAKLGISNRRQLHEAVEEKHRTHA